MNINPPSSMVDLLLQHICISNTTDPHQSLLYQLNGLALLSSHKTHSLPSFTSTFAQRQTNTRFYHTILYHTIVDNEIHRHYRHRKLCCCRFGAIHRVSWQSQSSGHKQVEELRGLRRRLRSCLYLTSDTSSQERQWHVHLRQQGRRSLLRWW